MLCGRRIQYPVNDTPLVWLRVRDSAASESAAMPLEKDRFGGPQFPGSWLLPVIPASPETFSRFAKYGVVRIVRRLNWYPRLKFSRWLAMYRQVALALNPVVLPVSSKPNTFGPELRALR